MRHETLDFLTRRFRNYYAHANIQLPPQPVQREWAFVRFDDFPDFVMRRHSSFSSPDKVMLYLRSEAPAHVYYSTAYYHAPGETTMKNKGWMGADVIFDLDADHLSNAPPDYSKMLEMVKKETRRLIRILEQDFGIEDMVVVFSGSRGYHIHVHDEKLKKLSSQHRRELVDYIKAEGMERKNLLESKGRGDRAIPLTGWQRRAWLEVFDVLSDISELRDEEVTAYLRERNIPIAGRGVSTLIKLSKHQEFLTIKDALPNVDDYTLLKVTTHLSPSKTYKRLIDYVTTRIGVEIDEPVTTDIKRLIRLIGSLHGKSGLKVMPISLDNLAEFNPLKDALAFSENPVKVQVHQPIEVDFVKKIRFDEGYVDVPEYLAVYMMVRELADII